MNRGLGLLASQAAKHFARAAPSRKLYTDPIYPYPHKYFNEYKFPSMQYYRENIYFPPGYIERDMYRGMWMMRLFWAYIFWCFFHDPAAVYGHHKFPDGKIWTDEELGIPPLEAGSYADHLAKQEVDE